MTEKSRLARRWIRRARGLVERAMTLYNASRVGKTMKRFGDHNGNVLAAGIAYYSLASIAAGLVLVATVASALVGSIPNWQDAFYNFLSTTIPGLVGSDGNGLVSADGVSGSGVAGAVGVVSVLVLLNTATRYVGGLRAGIRTMLGRASSSPLTGKLRDVIALVALLVIALVGVALQVTASRAADTVAGWLGWEDASGWGLRLGAGLAGLVADALFAAVALIVLGKANRTRRLWWVVGAVGVGIGILRLAVSASVAGSSDNPILAPFTAIITILLFVDLVNRLLMLGGAWLGTYTTPAGEGEDHVGGDADTTTITNRSAKYRDTPVTTSRVTVRS